MIEEGGFTVYQKCGITRIDNSTKQTLIVSIKPIKPKRKHIDVIIVPPLSFKIFDGVDNLNLAKLSFTLEIRCDT